MVTADVDAVSLIEISVQAYPWTRGNFCDAIVSGYFCCVEETAGELCGYAVLMPGVEEAELLNIGVASAFQRKGLGGRMLSAMLKMAADKGLKRVFLEVCAENHAAIALYLRAGFLQVGVRHGYYQNAAGSGDALVMVCDAAMDERVYGQA